MIDIARSLDAQIAAFMAVLLLASAAHKVIARRRLLQSTRQLTGLGEASSVPVLASAVLFEAAAGTGLLVPSAVVAAAASAAILWSGYAFLIWRAARHGRGVFDCGCSFGKIHGQPGKVTIARNVGLVATAIVTAVLAAGVGNDAVGAAEIMTGLGLFTLYAAFDQISAQAATRYAIS